MIRYIARKSGRKIAILPIRQSLQPSLWYSLKHRCVLRHCISAVSLYKGDNRNLHAYHGIRPGCSTNATTGGSRSSLNYHHSPEAHRCRIRPGYLIKRYHSGTIIGCRRSSFCNHHLSQARYCGIRPLHAGDEGFFGVRRPHFSTTSPNPEDDEKRAKKESPSVTRALYGDQDGTWIDKSELIPKWTRPYLKLARIDRPVGTWLLLWPCYWSIALASPPHTLPDPQLLVTFGVGAFVMRSAGCVINDLWDQDIDSQVKRTALRPLATGEISQRQAIGFLAGLLSIGLGVLLQLNPYSQVLGASSLLLVVVYPYMKRITHFPQLVLGLAFNWGALLGWSATCGSLDLSVVIPLYYAAICWTLLYDSIYALQDKSDDRRLGLGSTALFLQARGDRFTRRALSAAAISTIAGLTTAGIAAGEGWPFFAGVGAAALHFAWQLNTLKLGDDDVDRLNQNHRFVSNIQLGGILFLGTVLGKFF